MNNKKKNITYRKKFWSELQEDIGAKSFATFDRLRSHYLGYLHGLMITGKITELEQSEMENRLIWKVDCEINKKEKK